MTRWENELISSSFQKAIRKPLIANIFCNFLIQNNPLWRVRDTRCTTTICIQLKVSSNIRWKWIYILEDACKLNASSIFFQILPPKKFGMSTFTVGQKILKSPGQKNSWNQINQFCKKKTFWPNSIFCNFKNGQKSIFELGKSLKVAKNAISS